MCDCDWYDRLEILPIMCIAKNNSKNNEKWWYGRFSDLIMNTAGFYLLSWIA